MSNFNHVVEDERAISLPASNFNHLVEDERANSLPASNFNHLVEDERAISLPAGRRHPSTIPALDRIQVVNGQR